MPVRVRARLPRPCVIAKQSARRKRRARRLPVVRIDGGLVLLRRVGGGPAAGGRGGEKEAGNEERRLRVYVRGDKKREGVGKGTAWVRKVNSHEEYGGIMVCYAPYISYNPKTYRDVNIVRVLLSYQMTNRITAIFLLAINASTRYLHNRHLPV